MFRAGKYFVLITAAVLIAGGVLVTGFTRKSTTYGQAVNEYNKSVSEAANAMKVASVEATSTIRTAGSGDSVAVIQTVDQLVDTHRSEVEKVRATVEDVRIKGEEKAKAAKAQLATFSDPATVSRVQSEIAIFERQLVSFLSKAETELKAAETAIAAARERVVAAALIRDLRDMGTTIASAEKDLRHCKDAITAMASIQLPSEPLVSS
ncbi:MAG: hypothetical protein DIJKHBIC_00832 [Thermoanaerobaculia bacterium]|nr:hypothetical protein [Thermoanaerobaculia bacterium]MCG3191604.1 hypothetical protein [Thermoanaerobaculia bacterium]